MLGFNQYQAIPGHSVRFTDGNLNLKNDPNAPITESVVLLGTATDGPVGQPIGVTPDNAYQIFGKVTHDNGIPNGATLLPAFEEAWQAGLRDIRLMRVTGREAVSSLAGSPYTETSEEIVKETFIAQGNDELTFTLPHGNIVDGTLVVKADGFTLTEDTDYLSDLGDTVTNAEIHLIKDRINMEASITVSYTYEEDDGSGETVSYSVSDNNTDADGNAMVAKGYDQEITLQHVPLEGVRIYVLRGDNAVEIVDTSVFSVDAANKKVTIGSTNLIRNKEGIEISYRRSHSEVVVPTIQLQSVYGGSVYNETTVEVEQDTDTGIVTVTITKPESKKSIMSEAPMIFRSVNFPNFRLLVDAINSHPYNNNVVRASVSRQFEDQMTETLAVKSRVNFSGGSDEINVSKEEMYKRLGGVKDSEGYIVEQGAYQLLENYKVDYVVPLGVYSDDQLTGRYDNFAYQLALACAVMSHYNHVTIGIINASSPASTNLKDIEDHVRHLESQPNEFLMRDRFGTVISDGDGEVIDLGQFIQIIAGPDLVVGNTRMGAISTNTGASYAGFIGQLPVQSAPTNKAMPAVSGLRFEYSTAQINRLTQARYVTYRIKPNGQVGIVDAMTAARPGSDYTRVSTARIVKEAVNQVREVADPFIGEPNDIANRNALASAIEKRLKKLVELKALVSFEFQIIATPQMELIGEASIELSLRAPNELRRLTTIVGLDDAA